MAIYRRSGVNTEGICFKSVGYFLSLYIYQQGNKLFKVENFLEPFFLRYVYIYIYILSGNTLFQHYY